MDYTVARRSMVENQIRTNRITDPLVIAAMQSLPRELFVPAPLRGVAYVDEDLPLGHGRFMLEPLAAALLVQTAEIDPGDRVLVIGCGTGYEAAVVARMAASVTALECLPELAAAARDALLSAGCHNVAVVEGPLQDGWPAQAPYDAIIYGGAVSDVPQPVLDQLAGDSRLMAVVYGQSPIGKGMLFMKVGGMISRREMFDSTVRLLPGFARKPTFQF
jgi:protein-L-isoaspartate(D-aspartate) O-methyltransferase